MSEWYNGKWFDRILAVEAKLELIGGVVGSWSEVVVVSGACDCTVACEGERLCVGRRRRERVKVWLRTKMIGEIF